MVRMGIELIPDAPLQDIIRWSQLAEQAGFDNIWITDHFNNRNLWITLSAIALNTERVQIGPGVTNPYHTSPAISAAAAVTLHELTGGRAVIGVGAGDRTTLNALGIDWNRPVTTMVEALQIIRGLISGKRFSYNGSIFKIHKAKLTHAKRRPVLDKDGKPLLNDGRPIKQGPRIPIYAGVQGPMMLRAASKHADGILINASHPLDFRMAMKIIRESLREVGRSIDDLDIGAYTAFSLGDSREDALRGETRLIVAFIVAGSPRSIIERHGLDIDRCERVARLLEEHNFDGAAALVNDEMIDAFAIVGNSQQCIERIHQLIDEGVTHFIVGSPIGPDKDEAIKRIGREIIPHFKEREN